MDLLGKVIVITGASSGIGRAAAAEFARHGAKLVLCGRNPDGLQQTRQDCIKQGIGNQDICDVIGDICEDKTLDLIVKSAVDSFSRVDVLFLNAGKSHSMRGTVLKPETIDALDFYYEVFIKSQYKLTQKLSHELIKSKGNIIINGSISGHFVNAPNTPYSIIKAAQDQMTRLFALTFANKGVRVNAIRPGVVLTNLYSEDPSVAPHVKRIADATVNMTPLGRLATPEEIARGVVFLASNQSAAMTGCLLDLDMGFSMAHPAVDWTKF